MHVEILVEDLSGKKALDVLVPKIIGDQDTFRVHFYKGVGRIPKNMKDAADPSKRILLTNLPKLLKGYGRTFEGYPPGYRAAVVLVCDLDDRNRQDFLKDLNTILTPATRTPKPAFALRLRKEKRGSWATYPQ